MCFIRSSDKSTGPAEAMLFISFTAAMTCRKRPRTRKASGNLRRSTSLSSVRSVRSAEIMSRESRNAGFSSRRLRTGAEMATGSISFRRTGGLGKGWRRFCFPGHKGLRLFVRPPSSHIPCGKTVRKESWQWSSLWAMRTRSLWRSRSGLRGRKPVPHAESDP